MTRAPTVYVDVFGTLEHSPGQPIPGTIAAVRRLHAEGCTLVCWSSAGGDYARQACERLGIAELFEAFLTKPEVMLDDIRLRNWRGPLELNPREIEGQGRDFIESLLRR